MIPIPPLEQFRLEIAANGVAHLIFDCPGRTMNVFSDAAIVEIGAVAAWLETADVVGLLIRSGKANAFCAGADLGELGAAYDMIMAAPERRRFDTAYDHFFRLSHALRRLETAGKPVVAAIAGLALGGGCELALAAHHRVLVDDPKVAMGLPESLVGLLPGAGGTQRLPRLVGVPVALPVLLDGARLSGSAALEAGLVGTLCASDTEIDTAERWLLSRPEPIQPWDRDDWGPASAAAVAAQIAPVRQRVLAETLGHYPAPLAILDCVEHGLPQDFNGAIRTEMAIFSRLIQREEPRNMIATMFHARTDYDRRERKGELPPQLKRVTAAVEAVTRDPAHAAALTQAGFRLSEGEALPCRNRSTTGYWIDGPGADAMSAARAVAKVDAAADRASAGLSAEERALADYALVRDCGYPAYLGGPLLRTASP